MSKQEYEYQYECIILTKGGTDKVKLTLDDKAKDGWRVHKMCVNTALMENTRAYIIFEREVN